MGASHRSAPELVELLELLPIGSPAHPFRSGSAKKCRSASTPATHAPRSSLLREVGAGARPTDWREGVLWDEPSRSDFFAFTLDKSVGSLLPDDPVPRLRDQSRADPLGEPVRDFGCEPESAALHQPPRARHTIVLVRAACTRPSFLLVPRRQPNTAGHEGDRPIAFVWRLHHRLPGDLFASFAAAAA